jgi:RimJ/RimL family protein N-acetyltransferase
VIETERLRLRGHTLQDFANVARMWADPKVTRFIGGKPASREEAWGRILRYIGHWQALGFGYWLIEEKSGRFAGEVGFADMKRDITPSIDGMPEIGWALARAAQGRGFAAEAVKAALAWGDRHFASATSVCMIDPENAPSLKLAGKVGYAEFARTTYKGATTILLRR